MSDKRPSSAKLRRLCFEANKQKDELGVFMICHLTGARIDPVRDEWDAEHVVRRAASMDDSAKNLKPALRIPHREKTKIDNSETAKGKRVSDKHFGIKSRGWGGKYRKKMNGEVVER